MKVSTRVVATQHRQHPLIRLDNFNVEPARDQEFGQLSRPCPDVGHAGGADGASQSTAATGYDGRHLSYSQATTPKDVARASAFTSGTLTGIIACPCGFARSRRGQSACYVACLSAGSVPAD